MNAKDLLQKLQSGDRRALSRCISLVENEHPESAEILQQLQIPADSKIIGVTGPPGAGKSTLVNSLLDFYCKNHPGSKIAVLAIDPTSPFTHGSLLGDRLRMSEHFNNPDIFIRSLATRGALGGLSAKTIEISDVLKAGGFDYIIIETVGVGQSEVEIAMLADTTLVVFVPESGDEIQTIKSGIMEIADIFVVNKADREGADRLIKNIQSTLHDRKFTGWEVPVLKTIATAREGIKELAENIKNHGNHPHSINYRNEFLFSRAIRLLQNNFVNKLDINTLKEKLEEQAQKPDFNLYSFIYKWGS
jgi:LAO/AO transport system kinase